ncbi:MAG: hypothetical protein V2A70_04465 [Candidatus Omnitrophota bacterium]
MLFLPLIFLVFLSRILYWRKEGVLLVEALLASAVVAGLLSVFVVEMLGAFKVLTALAVAMVWGFSALAAGAVGVFHRMFFTRKFSVPSKAAPFSRFEFACVFVLIIVAALTALVAFVSPPNNWDSMTYHLPRVMHWAQQKSVAFFPTDIVRQNSYPPGAEYLLLHMFLLTSTDRWFNFLQWISLAGSCLGAGLIVRQLGGGRPAQWLGAVVTATIPMAILQATSTQTDLVESFWLMTSVVFTLKFRQGGSLFYIVIAAGSLALAVLTKGTCFVALPVLLWALWSARMSWKQKMLALALMVVLTVGINGLFWKRSVALSDRTDFVVQTWRPSALLLNSLRHASVHWTLPTCQDIPWLREAFAGVYRLLGEDSVAGVEGSVGYAGQSLMFRAARDEDYAGNFVHFFLYVAAGVCVFFVLPLRHVKAYAVCLMVSGAAFMGMMWQPWVSRMHLPLFILFAPVAGMWLGDKKIGRWLVLSIVVVSALFFLLEHQSRPLVGKNRLMVFDRNEYYFMKKPRVARSFFQAADIIRSSGCKDVGLIQGGDSWEYPLWVLTGYGQVGFRALVDYQAAPCLLVTLDRPMSPVLRLNEAVYEKSWEGVSIQVFKRVLSGPGGIQGY